MTDTRNPHGSLWHRWDPHIHAPGTVLNDQYSGPDAWERFLAKIETSSPLIRALGITDYYSLDTYEAVRQSKRSGRLTNVDLIFPNIEMRYGVGSSAAMPINVHLLASPEDPEHLDQIRRFLRGLTYFAYGEQFRCEKNDLVRLGRAHDATVQNDRTALEVGTNQFKVNPDNLREEYKSNTWIQENALIAVAAGSHDGTSGLQGDASLASLRKEIESRARVIFSGNPKQREFWLGDGSVNVERLNAEWDGCKLCLHGSDAHNHDAAGNPSQNRFCWIKGDLTFESLRQACLEPRIRSFIGDAPPRGALPSQVIKSIGITEAPWFKSNPVPLNAGLIGIIGARGSGKTALADIIAAGGYALASHLHDRSFIKRAADYLGDSAAELTWEDGETTANQFKSVEAEEFWDSPRVQYLSQQFVDTLCLAEGLTDELLTEIERVIYEAHPIEDRLGTTNFRELLDLCAAPGREQRRRHEEALEQEGHEINVQRERRANLPNLKKQRQEKQDVITKDKRDRKGILGKGSDERIKLLDQVSSAAEVVRSRVEQLRRRRQALVSLQNEVTATRTTRSPARLRQLQETYGEAGLTPENWKAFTLIFEGNVDQILTTALNTVDQEVRKLIGTTTITPAALPDPPPAESFLMANVELSKQPLNILDIEIARLRKLIGIDTENTKAFERLTQKITRDEGTLGKLNREIEAAEKADLAIQELVVSRRTNYRAVVDGIIDEETQLSSLYSPLKERLINEPGALGKLSFSVRRIVDINSWAKRGESLLDLRKNGPFKGHGTLLGAAILGLLNAWEAGSSEDVTKALSAFVEKHEEGLKAHAPDDATAYRKWGSEVSAWLYSTEHIKIAYSIQYEGQDIQQLSPGTRGIVLLLLYLAVDREDDRPLIIDQPEENLDPKSIFEELVARFRRAKLRRQIIIVTHNANLIINADADQVIVATCGSHQAGRLPEISYESGGLENPAIRKQVCEILEGGEEAFRERAKRLRIKM